MQQNTITEVNWNVEGLVSFFNWTKGLFRSDPQGFWTLSLSDGGTGERKRGTAGFPTEAGRGREEEEGWGWGCLLPEQGKSEGGGGAGLGASRWTPANNRGRQMQPQRAATTHSTQTHTSTHKNHETTSKCDFWGCSSSGGHQELQHKLCLDALTTHFCS